MPDSGTFPDCGGATPKLGAGGSLMPLAPGPPLLTERTQQTTQRDRPASTGRHRRPPLSGNASGQRQAGRSGQEGTYPTIWRIIPGTARLTNEAPRPGSESARLSGTLAAPPHPGDDAPRPSPPPAERPRTNLRYAAEKPRSSRNDGHSPDKKAEGTLPPPSPNEPHPLNPSNITSGQNPKTKHATEPSQPAPPAPTAARRKAMRSGKQEHPDKTGHPRPCASPPRITEVSLKTP
jgi:hypothetical protein